MTRLLSMLLVTGAVGLLANPTPADAQGTELEQRTAKCAKEAVTECDAEFRGDSWIMSGIRGWCYTIRTAMCLASDETLKSDDPTKS